MAPKKDGKKKGGKKGKKGNKPAWMSDGLWELSQNLQKLSEFYSGEIKDTKLKEGQAPPPNITRTQAGMFIWQLLFPSNKVAKAKRDEAVKYGVVETSVKILASGKVPDMTPALGILVAMTGDNPLQRGVMLDTKPAPLPHVLAALSDESASLRAASCALLRVVSREQDSRPRLWRLMRADWDWRPLVTCLDLTDMSQLGGRSACYDAAAVMEAMCCAPEQDIANGACTALMNAGAPAHMVKVPPSCTLEAQVYASAVCRLVSLAEEQRGALVEAAAIRYLPPLLEAKNSAARWNARQVVNRARKVAALDGVLKSLVQLCAGPEGPLPDLETLINLSMAPELLPKLQLYKVPDYVHQANVPQSHFERPLQPQSNAGLLQHQDSVGRKKDGGGLAAVVARVKPPALKSKT
ncbi:hypothetical protein VOLCADRAFT_99422 [Volvox carteri f. nagariensis]|uniref:Uncharacterized protein n=1 Tax=Volvox carteri f. nagariensis TaxID=3068 RepID=D8UHR9_VOLCA|nr:uncharacterized protein VOLCADRAFT_99422 [Volvox carteri f. nagariensis]EFJ40751.1 hypothetical protein VOLCADRAFT_99422 [Volvox carteri f. nagariensis]|eukprot:XP_002958217.1 hypothetical protein VOLCADRAFT_99422 [Volvox carteri f. nagariensis]